MMSIHRLSAFYADGAFEVDMAKEGAFVVPEIVLTGSSGHHFESIPGFQHCSTAIVAEPLDEEELETMFKAYRGQYPGLPEMYLRARFVSTAAAASKLPLGTVVRVYVNDGNAHLQRIDDESLHEIWNNLQPV